MSSLDASACKSQRTQSSSSNAPMTSEVQKRLCWTQTIKLTLVHCLPTHLTNRISASPSVCGVPRPTLTSPSPAEETWKTSSRLKLNHLPGGSAELLYRNGTSKRGSRGITEAISSSAGRKCQEKIYGSSQRRLKYFTAEQSAPADRQSDFVQTSVGHSSV